MMVVMDFVAMCFMNLIGVLLEITPVVHVDVMQEVLKVHGMQKISSGLCNWLFPHSRIFHILIG